MKHHAAFLGSLVILLVSGCASLQTSGEFQAGRNALLTGNTEAALPYFQASPKKPLATFTARHITRVYWVFSAALNIP